MARHRRLLLPGVAAHVRQRGVNGETCFASDSDRLVYLALLRDALASTGCELHAYCLMTNHVHLLVTPPDELAGSDLMYEVGRRYVPYFNRRHGRTGTLWEGRFRSCLVESREYVLACYRYIERNPVRAGMVDSPAAYQWSSYSGNAGHRDDALVSPHPEYLALAGDVASRRLAYEGFCVEYDSAQFVAAIRDATDTGVPMVSDYLKAALAQKGIRVERGKPGPRRLAAKDAAPTLELV